MAPDQHGHNNMQTQRVPWETMIVTSLVLLVYIELVRLREAVVTMSARLEKADSERRTMLERQYAMLSIVQNAPAGQMTTATGGGANVGGNQAGAGDALQAV